MRGDDVSSCSKRDHVAAALARWPSAGAPVVHPSPGPDAVHRGVLAPGALQADQQRLGPQDAVYARPPPRPLGQRLVRAPPRVQAYYRFALRERVPVLARRRPVWAQRSLVLASARVGHVLEELPDAGLAPLTAPRGLDALSVQPERDGAAGVAVECNAGRSAEHRYGTRPWVRSSCCTCPGYHVPPRDTSGSKGVVRAASVMPCLDLLGQVHRVLVRDDCAECRHRLAAEVGGTNSGSFVDSIRPPASRTWRSRRNNASGPRRSIRSLCTNRPQS